MRGLSGGDAWEGACAVKEGGVDQCCQGSNYGVQGQQKAQEHYPRLRQGSSVSRLLQGAVFVSVSAYTASLPRGKVR